MSETEIDRLTSESLKQLIISQNLITGNYFEEPDGSLADRSFK
jgi:hypothetical protein